MDSDRRSRRLLLHPEEGRLEAVDPRDVYLLEAADTDTLVRLRSATPVHDVRRFAELVERFEPFGFLRIHRSYAVDRVREIRLRENRRDRELDVDRGEDDAREG